MAWCSSRSRRACCLHDVSPGVRFPFAPAGRSQPAPPPWLVLALGEASVGSSCATKTTNHQSSRRGWNWNWDFSLERHVQFRREGHTGRQLCGASASIIPPRRRSLGKAPSSPRAKREKEAVGAFQNCWDGVDGSSGRAGNNQPGAPKSATQDLGTTLSA